MSYVEEIDKLRARLDRLRAAESRVLDGLAREAHEARQALYDCEAERDEARAALARVRALADEWQSVADITDQSYAAGVWRYSAGELLTAIDGPQS